MYTPDFIFHHHPVYTGTLYHNLFKYSNNILFIITLNTRSAWSGLAWKIIRYYIQSHTHDHTCFFSEYLYRRSALRQLSCVFFGVENDHGRPQHVASIHDDALHGTKLLECGLGRMDGRRSGRVSGCGWVVGGWISGWMNWREVGERQRKEFTPPQTLVQTA